MLNDEQIREIIVTAYPKAGLDLRLSRMVVGVMSAIRTAVAEALVLTEQREARAVAAEREACAGIVARSEDWLIENCGPSFATSLLGQIGGSIRARGDSDD